MADNINFKKFFLIVLIASLIIGALTSILIFLFGEFSEVEIRILLTTFVIAATSLVGLVHSKIETEYVRVLGLTMLGIMFVITILTIWEVGDFEFFARSILTYIVLIALLAQAPWILKSHEKQAVQAMAIATFAFASILALMVILLIVDIVEFKELYYRFLGVFAVLYVLGLVLIPIFKKLFHESNSQL